MVEQVDTPDLKSCEHLLVPVRLRPEVHPVKVVKVVLDENEIPAVMLT